MCICALLCIVSGISGYLLRDLSRGACDAQEAWHKLQLSSPMMDVIGVETHLEKLNGGVVDLEGSTFNEPLSPDVTFAWSNLSFSRVLPVTSAYLRERGVDPAIAAKIPERYGFGNDAYGASSDTQHLLHCLNRVRKDVYFDYYFQSIWPDGKVSDLHRFHTAHCLKILRQFIVCQSSMDLIPKIWREGEPHPVNEFSIVRKCGNYDSLWQYANSDGIDPEEFDGLEASPGTSKAPKSEDWLRLLGQDDPNPEDYGY
ncbi:hypothetical protein LTR17_008744 [Elasticomyces elasticus]|nr:hypothetical protein LTR17_008744 [Elasticomyces elasticus]